MELPGKAIEELKDLYRKHRNTELSDQEAREIAENLLTIAVLVYKPIPKRLLDEHKNDFPELIQLLDRKQNLS
jgi:hypothetical protein